MMVILAPMSDRLERIVHVSDLRNFRATCRHYDAAGTRELSVVPQPADEAPYDRYARSMIESGICWRDVNARRAS